MTAHGFRSHVKEYPASPEVVDRWENKRVYSRKSGLFAFVRGVFIREGFDRPGARVTWLVLRRTDKKLVTTVSLTQGTCSRERTDTTSRPREGNGRA